MIANFIERVFDDTVGLMVDDVRKSWIFKKFGASLKLVSLSWNLDENPPDPIRICEVYFI